MHRIGLIAIILLITTLGSAVVFAVTSRAERVGRRARLALAGVLLLVYGSACAATPQAWWLIDAFLLLVAAVLASILGRLIASASSLVAFAVTVTIVDIFSFSWGLTHVMIADSLSDRSLLLWHLSVSVPLQGRVAPLVGIGDYLVLGVFFAALRRLGHSAGASAIVPLAGLLGAVIVGLVVGGTWALPFEAAAVVLYLWVARGRRREHGYLVGKP